MTLDYVPTDWYHCDIYQNRLFSWKLIAQAKLDFNDEVTLEVYKESSFLYDNLSDVEATARQLILEARKNTDQEEE